MLVDDVELLLVLVVVSVVDVVDEVELVLEVDVVSLVVVVDVVDEEVPTTHDHSFYSAGSEHRPTG